MDRKKLADGLRLIADAIDEAAPIKSEAASVVAEKRKTKALPDKKRPTSDWRTVQLVSKANPDQTNIYQILVDKFGVNNPIPAEECRDLFKGRPSLQRILLELKRLEVEKLAIAIDALRLKWILLKP